LAPGTATPSPTAREQATRRLSINRKRILNEKKSASQSAFFNSRAWSDYKSVIKKGMKLIRKSVTFIHPSDRVTFGKKVYLSEHQ
jgi:hypothetical protein